MSKGQEERRTPRIKTHDLMARITTRPGDGLSFIPVEVVDIGRFGAFVDGYCSETNDYEISFTSEGGPTISRLARATRKSTPEENKRWIALRFNEPLTESDLFLVTHGKDTDFNSGHLIKLEKVWGTIRDETQSEKDTMDYKVQITEISRSGVFIRNFYPERDLYQITISAERHRPITRLAEVIQRSDSKSTDQWAALRFIQKMTDSQFFLATGGKSDRICPGDAAAFELAKGDKQLLVSETHAIKLCRSNIFVWTIGTLMTVGFAIWMAFVEHKLTVASVTIAVGCLFLVFLFSTLILLEKAKAVNMREGFVAAVDLYLAEELAPPNFQGWSQMKQCLSECGARRRAGSCPRRISHDDKGCLDDGYSKSSKISAATYAIPGTLDSFSSLVTAIYAFSFLCLSAGFAYTLATFLDTLGPIGIGTACICFGIGFS